jgi:molybdopterin molybdotransferase
MISYKDALSIIAANVERTALETIMPICGRVCAVSMSSPVDVPGFANSAMDGFALRSVDCGGEQPIRLRVNGTITAGMTAPDAEAKPGTAWEIMTGAPLPKGYDAVIPVEKTRRDGDFVDLTVKPAAGANIRNPGEDFSTSAPVIEAGTVITPEILMGLAAVGIDSVSAYKQPNVAIITTGNEISSNSSDAKRGIIRDSNRPYLEAAVAQSGALLTRTCSVNDDAAALAEAITKVSETADIVVTTGGVSAGRMDFVPAVLARLGAEILFHKVAIRPGKPILFAKLPDNTLVFGLPGNPVAVAVGWRFFVTEAIRQMLGKNPGTYSGAKLINDTGSRAGLRFFAKARSRVNNHGGLEVEVLPGQQSFKISPLMRANCWAIFTEDNTECQAGEQVLIAPMTPDL